MFGKALLVAALILGAVLFQLLAGTYPSLPLAYFSLSLFAVAGVYIVIIIFLNYVIFKTIDDEKTRFTINRVTSILAFVVIAAILIRIWVSDTSSFLVSLGVIGAGVAIGLQDVFKNFIGGVIVLSGRLYRVGDRIELGGEIGDVIDIGVMNTTLLERGGWMHGEQPTGRVTFLPNGMVITRQVHNYTKDHSFIWDEVTIPVTYDSDWKRAKEIMLSIAQEETSATTGQAEMEIDRLGEKYYLPRNVVEPVVYLTPTDNWITFNLRYVTLVRDRTNVKTRLYERIVSKIQEIPEITIASGTMTVTVIKPKES